MTSRSANGGEQILGIRFFNGSAPEAVERAITVGGLIVAPSGTCFARLEDDATYRRAVMTADIALPDSGLMVSLWRRRTGRALNRISGLAYLKQLLVAPKFGRGAEAVWLLPHERARNHLLAWSSANGASIAPDQCYIAPIYKSEVEDETLLGMIRRRKPAHVVIAIGAGAQEKLGWYLRENAGYRPAIHCIGGALGFITGDQVAIPDWVDRLYLGWFLRLLSQPRVFLPRLWKARRLLWLLPQFESNEPPLRSR